jgi:hypothetical protein
MDTKTKPLLKQELGGSARYLSFVCYDPYPFALSVNKLLMCTSVQDVAYILHDRDEGKTDHYHVVIMLNRSRRIQDIVNFLQKNFFKGNVLYEPVRDGAAVFDYLTHDTKGDENKAVYFPHEVQSSISSDEWKKLYSGVGTVKQSDKEDGILCAYIDLVSGLDVESCARKYGRDFIIHYGHIKNLLQDSGYYCDCGMWLARGLDSDSVETHYKYKNFKELQK